MSEDLKLNQVNSLTYYNNLEFSKSSTLNSFITTTQINLNSSSNLLAFANFLEMRKFQSLNSISSNDKNSPNLSPDEKNEQKNLKYSSNDINSLFSDCKSATNFLPCLTKKLKTFEEEFKKYQKAQQLKNMNNSDLENILKVEENALNKLINSKSEFESFFNLLENSKIRTLIK